MWKLIDLGTDVISVAVGIILLSQCFGWKAAIGIALLAYYSKPHTS